MSSLSAEQLRRPELEPERGYQIVVRWKAGFSSCLNGETRRRQDMEMCQSRFNPMVVLRGS